MSKFFSPLGHDRGRFYVMPSRGGQVRDFSARDLTAHGSLLELAPITYWEMNFPSKGEGFNARAAANSIMQSCFAIGIFDPGRLRGRGAWLDKGRTVLHLGNKLIVDGADVEIGKLDTDYIYESGRKFDLPLGKKLSAKEAARLIDLCLACPWQDRESMAILLAGWLVIAPICGAMPWRPHIWITSEAGGGKTWILKNIVETVVGSIALRAQSKTTEAGLRGELGIDARPVIFDEFESQNETDRARIQLVLDLARQASSEDGAEILKGTQTGAVKRYRVRSCFAYSSVNLGMEQAADESRTITLTLAPPADPAERADHFHALQGCHKELMTPDFPARLLARSLHMMPIIRENCEVFATAIARAGHSRRLGDTIGVLLAGAWSLRSDAVASAIDAENFLAENGWAATAIARSEVLPDWKRAANHLMQQRLRYNGHNGRSEEIPIGVLILSARNVLDADAIGSPAEIRKALTWAGIKVAPDCLLVSTQSDQVKRCFDHTPWASGWLATLRRMPGAGNFDNRTVAFGATRTKAVSLSYPQLFETEDT